MKTFKILLANTLLAGVTNNFVWFALVFWGYLETRSVLVTSVVGGIFLVFTAASGFWFGAIVDHNRKKKAMMISSAASLALYLAGLGVYAAAPQEALRSVASPWLWLLIVILLAGVIFGNIRGIAMPTAVSILVPEEGRDKANGMLGMMMGVSFSITSVASGLALGYGSMFWVIAASAALTLLAMLHLAFVPVPEAEIVQGGAKPKVDIKGTYAVVKEIPGLLALIFFTTFNNFLGGVFMSLMDAYGLTLVSVQFWGTLWGFLSMGFVLGGLYISKFGLGRNPLTTLFGVNIILWNIAIFMAIQPWIALLAAGAFLWVCLAPFAEAIEHSIIQKVVPLDRQGRVFGFAQSVEQSASPITAFLIGPIAEFIFIPFMTTGRGVELIGGWFGTGPGRGMALVFIASGLVGLAVTLLAMRSGSYKLLGARYREP